MHPFYEAYLDRLNSLHDGLRESIAGLRPEALDWRPPGEQTNSLAVLLAHVAGAERYWIGDLVGRDPSARVRASEFETAGLERATLLGALDQALQHSRIVLSTLSLDALAEPRHAPLNERTYTVAYCLVHALEHTALHLGHAQLTRQWWEQAGRGG